MRDRLQLGDTTIELLTVPGGGSPLRKMLAPDEPPLEVVFPLRAPIAVRRDLREDAVLPTEALYLVGCARYTTYSSQGSAALTVTMPRSVVVEYLDGEPSGHIRNSAVLTPAKRFLAGIMTQRQQPDQLPAYLLEKLVWKMTASLLLEVRGVTALMPATVSTFERAVAEISAVCTDQSLSPATLARRLNLSPRQLQRAFANAGTTPSQQIRRQRANLALSLLHNPAYESLNITQIAHHSGFTEAGELRRAFDAFGHPAPNLIRRQRHAGTRG